MDDKQTELKTEETQQTAPENGSTASAQQPQAQTPVVIPRARIIFVMIIVAVICGGNGMGIVTAGLY